jgi:hypothetical protein
MKIFKIKWFNQWGIKEKITDSELLQAIREIEQGLIDANLGGNIYKKRVSYQGRGKRSGARTLVALKVNDRAFFVYGFTKNQPDNINERELKALKQLAKELIQYDDEKLRNTMVVG